MGSDMGISLGYRAWAGLITQTDASCHRNLLPIPTWKVQNKKFARDSPSEEITHGYIYHLGSGLLRRTIALLSDILLSKFPQFKIEKLKLKIRKGFPIIRVQTQAYRLNIGLELGLDLDLHYQDSIRRTPIHFNKDLSVSCPSTSNTQETQVTIADYGRQQPHPAVPSLGSQKVEAETFTLARVTYRSDISPFQISQIQRLQFH